MKVLLVDNGTHFKKKLSSLLEGYEITRVEQPQLDTQILEQGFDFIVLSGADGGHSAKYHAHKHFKNELQLIQAAQIPVIGICLGAQLIAKLYDAELSLINKSGRRKRGYKKVWKVKRVPLELNHHAARVWASQKWRISELPPDLETWCVSKDGVEVFKHTTKPIYGLQFHPEYQNGDNDGRRIFNKIVALAALG